MRVVVIGGSGHVGTFLVPRLVEAGHEVAASPKPRSCWATGLAAGRAGGAGMVDRTRPGGCGMARRNPEIDGKLALLVFGVEGP
jgi:NAD(P)-dependent dehydrogenase (short-subunit alcohol dehydrogenase family)